MELHKPLLDSIPFEPEMGRCPVFDAVLDKPPYEALVPPDH